jgi:hypothetical protein
MQLSCQDRWDGWLARWRVAGWVFAKNSGGQNQFVQACQAQFVDLAFMLDLHSASLLKQVLAVDSRWLHAWR